MGVWLWGEALVGFTVVYGTSAGLQVGCPAQ